jgi:putative membrane protein
MNQELARTPTPKATAAADSLREVDPRVVLAAERTLLAWVRTGLAMMGFGFVVSRFGLFLREIAAASGSISPRHSIHSHIIGVGLVLLGTIVLIVSSLRHIRYIRTLLTGDASAIPDQTVGLIVAMTLAALGMALAVYLVVVG